MCEINYFKGFVLWRWCGRWWGPIAYERYKLVDDMTVDDVDSLHVKIIALNDW
jgi:hypothetical protein